MMGTTNNQTAIFHYTSVDQLIPAGLGPIP